MTDAIINKKGSLPELLAPAGSRASLEAAIAGGADAVYLGGKRHNARAGAANFGEDELRDATALAHAHDVRVYFTLNTLATDRELPGVLEDARAAYLAGVDALIVADLGVASALREMLPDLPLHASTQASGHGTGGAKALYAMGFSRMVCARELSLEDIRTLTVCSPVEIEMFVHGALCVSHSGQCLFSSLVGGRSGNRGECAQPCRLPYRTAGGNEYPLSLKDLSLARHVPALIDSGVASLKIEGRMKSPEYVFAVTSVWRRLLDERRGADDGEMEYLASVFSRDGFTDGYFTRRIGHDMLGVRGEERKSDSRALPPFAGIERRPVLDMDARICAGEPMSLTVCSGERRATVRGDIPEPAIKLPADRDTLLRNLSKLGRTPYSPGQLTLTLEPGLSVPLSKLNALRRDAVAALLSTGRGAGNIHDLPTRAAMPSERRSTRTARFASAYGIPENAAGYFDIVFLPPEELQKLGGRLSRGEVETGVVLPAVIFDSEIPQVRSMLREARAAGARHALVGNIGHIALAEEYGFVPHGDFRLNITNTAALAAYRRRGLSDAILSPELTLPQLRDMPGGGVIVYGRIPLMLLEKCAARDTCGCSSCSAGTASLTDRRGVVFPLMREYPHRTSVLNSLPTSMSDRQADLERCGITNRHFIFTIEDRTEAEAVIEAFKKSKPLPREVRRI